MFAVSYFVVNSFTIWTTERPSTTRASENLPFCINTVYIMQVHLEFESDIIWSNERIIRRFLFRNEDG